MTPQPTCWTFSGSAPICSSSSSSCSSATMTGWDGSPGCLGRQASAAETSLKADMPRETTASSRQRVDHRCGVLPPIVRAIRPVRVLALALECSGAYAEREPILLNGGVVVSCLLYTSP